MNIEKNHYVDNVATGEQSVEAAVDHYKEAKQLFQSACMNLREWYSNSKEVRESFAEADKGIDTEPKILGLRWNVDTDILHVEPVKDSSHLPTTKRNILKTIAQVFDPLGFYSPVTVEGKLLVQELWRSNHGWDDNVPKEIADKWNKVRTSLEAIPASGIPRFVGNPSRCGVELHVFCDASVKACGVAVYLLLRNEDSTSCNLMMAKTRLAPMKSPLTIPRLELVAAVIGARVLKFVADQLEVSPVEKFLWTDSQCTIHWIKRIKMSTKFVENRVSEIRQQPDIRLQYVPSEYNPADLPSRGCDMITLQNAHLWWHGPSWLSDRSKWPVFPLSSHVEVPEVIEENALVVNDATIINVIDETKFSSVNRLLRCTGYVLRFIKNLRQPGTQRQRGLLTIHELNQSQVLWHRIIQRKSFPDLIRFKGSTWPKGIGRQLNLFKDADGVLRSFGRVANTLSLSYDAKYPVLLPKTGHFTDLVVMDCHIRLLHGGPAETLAHLRQQVWIIHGRTTVRRVLRSCPLCRLKEGGPYQIPPAPPLPETRVNEAPPFLHTGLDYLGPLYVRHFDGSNRKVWICLYTCMVVRAVYLDIVDDLSTEQFLLSLRRFIAHFGTPSLILSDNAPHFHASHKVIKRLWQQLLESAAVQNFASHRGIEWNFVVEYAPWMGGFYERLVGEVKRSLKKSLDGIMATPSELATIVSEIAAVINARPLLYNEDEVGIFPLTPSHFLAKGQSVGLPTFSRKEDDDDFVAHVRATDTLVSKWKRLQAVTEQFWNVWRQQYLLSLRERSVGLKQRNCSDIQPAVNSVVQVKDNFPRGVWKLGIISELHTGRDGLARSASIRLASGKYIKRPLKLLYPVEVGEERLHSGASGAFPDASPNDPKGSITRPSRSAAVVARRQWRHQLGGELLENEQ